jgi:Leucine-rich repeat (LRR) protein
LNTNVFDVVALLTAINNTMMRLPQELAMLVGSFLDARDVRVCTTQLCSSETEFVSAGFTNTTTTIILLHELAALCLPWPWTVDSVTQECIERVESFLARRGNVKTIIMDAQLCFMDACFFPVFSEIHRRLQQGSLFQLDQNQEITVEWHVDAEPIEQVEFLLEVDVPKDGAGGSDSSAAGGAMRSYLHTLDLSNTEVSDVSVLASCQSLHTLDLSETEVSDVSVLASCQSLHTLKLNATEVTDVSALASCQSLHTLDLSETEVSDVSVLASCQSLHTLDLRATEVSDVSVLASCQSLHTLNLAGTQVSDVSALASCQSLRTLNLAGTQVTDVTALASCQSLHTLNLSKTQVSDVSALASCRTLHTLDLRYTQVSDVSALASCQSLHRLYLSNSKVIDVSALASCQSLSQLWGADGMVGAADVLQIMQGRG